jgi:hypothetical protein
MGIPKTDSQTGANSRKTRLRGSALEGSEQKSAPDHVEYEKSRDPDAELRLDGEDDSLYSDGMDLEIDEEDDTLAGTRGTSSGIKP